MRQALGPGTLGRLRGSGWKGRWEGGSGWGTHVNPWLFHFNVWQNSLQIKKNKKIYNIKYQFNNTKLLKPTFKKGISIFLQNKYFPLPFLKNIPQKIFLMFTSVKNKNLWPQLS